MAKLIDMDARVAELTTQAHEAESRVAYGGTSSTGKTTASGLEEFAQARDNFESVFTDAQRKRAKAKI